MNGTAGHYITSSYTDVVVVKGQEHFSSTITVGYTASSVKGVLVHTQMRLLRMVAVLTLLIPSLKFTTRLIPNLITNILQKLGTINV